jgi:hypothetical protein
VKSLTGDTFVMRTLMWRASIALTDDLKLLLPIRWSPRRNG